MTPLAAIAPLALQGPDNPASNVLGWLIVIAMIVWPVVKGIVESANERRREHVEKEKRKERRVERTRRRFGGTGSETVLVPGRDGVSEPVVVQTDATAGPRRAEPEPVPEVDHVEDLVGDPYDDAEFERQLVREAERHALPEAPPENVAEAAASVERPDDIREAPLDTSVASSIRRVGRRSEAVVLQRVRDRARSPWHRAYLHRELLDAPLALRPERIV